MGVAEQVSCRKGIWGLCRGVRSEQQRGRLARTLKARRDRFKGPAAGAHMRKLLRLEGKTKPTPHETGS